MCSTGAAVLQTQELEADHSVVNELEANHSAVNAELNAIRKAVADDNEELVIKGVKGVTAAQELISKLFCYYSCIFLMVHISNGSVLLQTQQCMDCMCRH